MAISQVASLLSAISYLGQPGEMYGNDLRQFIKQMAGFLAAPLAIYLFIDFFYRLKIISTYEYLERRFNAPTRVLTSAFFILLRITWMSTIVSATAMVMNKLTGLKVEHCIILFAATTTLYTLLGGMKAIIWTDILQFCLFMSGVIGVWILIGRENSIGELVEVVVRDNKHRMFDWQWDPTVRITTWAAIFSGIVTGLGSVNDQVSMQRYLSAKSLREAHKAIWMKPVVTIPVQMLLCGLGLALYAHYQLHPDRAVGINAPDEAFPHFILTEVPHGLAGLIVAAIFAAGMSSMDSGIHCLSTVSIQDYYKRFIRPDAPDSHYLNLARILTLVWGCVIAVVALSFSDIGTIVEMIGKLAGPFFGCVLGIFVLGTTTRRATSWGAFLGGLCGYALVLFVMLGLQRVDGIWEIKWAWGLKEGKVTWMWYPFISFAGTLVLGYLISLFMKPVPREKLIGLTIWDRPSGESVGENPAVEG